MSDQAPAKPTIWPPNGRGAGGSELPILDVVRKVDIAHSGQVVSEAMAQLKREIEAAHRGGERLLLVVHGFGASGVGGAIKAALEDELPALARSYGFKAYGDADKSRIPKHLDAEGRMVNPGATLLVFPEGPPGRESAPDFRPNFRNLRSKVTVSTRSPGTAPLVQACRHARRKLVARGPAGSSYRCRTCGKTFLVTGES